jgi:hypothetical protein
VVLRAASGWWSWDGRDQRNRRMGHENTKDHGHMREIMRCAIGITVLAVVAAWPPLASAGDNAALDKLRMCVRSHAPAARAAGVQTAGEAVQYFERACLPDAGQIPLVALFLGSDQVTGIPVEPAEAVPPGSFRAVIQEEAAAFLSRAGSP